MSSSFSVTIVIDHCTTHGRWRVTHKGALDEITRSTGCEVRTVGFYKCAADPLALVVTGASARQVEACRAWIAQTLREADAELPPCQEKYSRYSVV
jgi:hypothetical protein